MMLAITELAECRPRITPQMRPGSSNYFSLAQNPTSDVVMKINGRVSPMITFGDGQMQASTISAGGMERAIQEGAGGRDGAIRQGVIGRELYMLGAFAYIVGGGSARSEAIAISM
jgi:hypothetical protein